MSADPPPTPVRPPGVRLRRVPVEEVRRLLTGRAAPGVPVPRHPDYPMGETFDLAAMVLGAYEAGGPVPRRPRWWIHQIVVAGTVVGDVGFHGPPGPESPLTVEIGYAVVAPWRGRGVATEACRQLVAQAWVDGADRVVAETEPGNPASRRVLQRVGFRAGADGAYVIERPAPDLEKTAGRLPDTGAGTGNLPAFFPSGGARP